MISLGIAAEVTLRSIRYRETTEASQMMGRGYTKNLPTA